MDLVLKDQTTGESKVFAGSTEGYQQAANWRNQQESAGHIISDGLNGAGSLGSLNSIYPDYTNSPYR
ncbi:hypothetical protein IJG66_01145 [Candidatus Saccharibacteria bacterium]|nr:hypothetical protein [Candidatus Saccharibacteria bacterium]